MMVTIRLATIPLLILLLLAWGCASVKLDVPRDIEPAKFWKAQEQKQHALRSLTAKISILVDSEEVSARGRGAIASRLSGKRGLRLELRDPLGKVQYLALLNGNDFSAFVLSQALEIRDREAGRRYLRKSLGMDLSFEEIQELVIGVLPGAKAPGWNWERPRAPMPRLAKSSSHWADIDPDVNEVREARWKDVGIQYSDFRPCCATRDGSTNPDPMVVARRVVLKSLGAKQGELRFDWSEISQVEDLKDSTFAPPNVKGFRREDLSGPRNKL